MKQTSFFAGQEEVFARIASLVISTIFFLIFIIAREQISLNYQSTVVFISIFWIIYESLSLILFQFFRYFANTKNDNKPEVIENKKPETNINHISDDENS